MHGKELILLLLLLALIAWFTEPLSNRLRYQQIKHHNLKTTLARSVRLEDIV